MPRQAGDKLGPRLASLVLQHNLALRRQLAPVEAKIHAAGTQQVIDRAGLEVATLYRPIHNALIEAHPEMHPLAAEFLAKAKSGQHQWESMAANMLLGGITGGFGTLLTNYLAPGVQRLVALDPSLLLDQTAAASATAAGLISYGDGETFAAKAGFGSSQFAILSKMAQAVPGPPELFQLANRGLLSEGELTAWLQRDTIPPELVALVAQLRYQLLDPADAALAVLRGNISADAGYAAAAQQGMSQEIFDVLIGNTGEPLALEEMLMLWRRGLADEATLDRAILQSRVRDEWVPYAKLLAVEPPSAADVLNALVQGQISQAEAQKRFAEAGGDPTWFQAAYDSTANSPAPEQLAEMANRGIIPWEGTGPQAVSWQQGFYEGRWKDKWAPAFKQLAVYHAPPREIATLVKEGGMTQDEAMAAWAEAGVPPELANQYWQAAHYDRTSTIHQLAQGEIIKLYNDKAITRDEAKSMLESVNWTAVDAEWLLDIADVTLERSLLNKAIAKVGALYLAYKITAQEASSALANLEVPASQVQQELAVWDLERGLNVKVLTGAEITDAWYYQLISPQTAQAMLQQIGYTAYDAWLLLNIKNKGPIEDFPEP